MIIFLMIVSAGIIFFLQQYVFNIYEVRFSVVPDLQIYSPGTEITITAIPLNAFGTKTPIKSARAVFTIVSGENLTESYRSPDNPDAVKIITKDGSGEAVILAESEFTFRPSRIKIIVGNK
mgnify:CR=1 FL=1